MSNDRAGDVLKRYAPMIYGPTTLFALGEGAVLPLLPVIATDLGAGIAAASLVAAARVVGQLIGNLPAAFTVARIGERAAMVGSGTLSLVGAIGLASAPSFPVLVAAAFLIGVSAAVFGLARHSFMTTRVPLAFRARALSLLGGSYRLGTFLGPFAAAALLALSGTEQSSIWFFVGCLVALILLVLLGPDPVQQAELDDLRARVVRPADEAAADTGEPVTGPVRIPRGSEGVLPTMWRYRGVLLRLGMAGATMSGARAARTALLPLWGISIGLDGASIALVAGISGALDFALFYASGQVMDRFGRLWAALPAMLLMGGGLLALSFTHDMDDAQMWFAAFAMVLGVGNGLSSGILLTLGADLAPRHDPAPFLGSWRTLGDAGGAAAPLIISGVTAIWAIGPAAAIIGVATLLGALGFLRWVPRYVPRPPA